MAFNPGNRQSAAGLVFALLGMGKCPIIFSNMKKALSGWFVLCLLGWQGGLFGQTSIERIIHTDGKPSLVGEGIAKVSKSGGNIEVSIYDLSLFARHITAGKTKIIGFQVGLLAPGQRVQRTGAQYGKRIPQEWESRGGDRYELGEPLTATFPEEQGANLDDYHACLRIYVTHNDVSEAVVIAHTAEAFAHRDFFPLRKAHDDIPVSPATQKVVITPPLQTKFDDLNAFVKRIRDGFDKAAQKSEQRRSDKIAELDQSYLKQLEQVQKYYVDRGDSVAALKVRAEIRRVSGEEDVSPGEFSGKENLERLRKSLQLYTDARKLIEKEFETELGNLIDLGNEGLKQQASELTRKGDLDRVEALAAVIPTWHGRPISQVANRTLSMAGVKPLWVLKSSGDVNEIKGISVSKNSDGWFLEKGAGINTQFASNKKFVPPFKIVIRLKPATGASVRIMYKEQFLAELNQGAAGEDLILHNPDKARQVIAGKGKLKMGQMNELEFWVSKTKLELRVDGEKRGEIASDFSQNDGVISISPFRDCPVLVEKFEIWPY
jgi:hypothetical protein